MHIMHLKIILSGHSHFSLIDKRSIWKGEFDAITTHENQNCLVPKDKFGNIALANRNYTGLIMTVMIRQ